MNKIIAKKMLRFFKNVVGTILDSGKTYIRKLDGSNDLEYRFLGIRLFGGSHQNEESGVPDIYLKVNADTDYSLLCIQQWLNVAACMNRNVYIVCDDKILENKVRRRCFFVKNYQFIRSNKRKLRNIARNLYSGFWENATYAHLTPFLHSNFRGKKTHWNIDGDDTMFLVKPEKIAEMLEIIEKKSLDENIVFNSMDMWFSRTCGHHWTLGVLFVNDYCNIFERFEQTENLEWGNHYLKYTQFLNLDWYITYLKNETDVIVSSFYPDKAWFIHWGSFIMSPLGSGVYYFDRDVLKFPIINEIFKNTDLGTREIVESYCVDLGLTGEEGPQFLANEVCYEKHNSKQINNMHGIGPDEFLSQGIIPL